MKRKITEINYSQRKMWKDRVLIQAVTLGIYKRNSVQMISPQLLHTSENCTSLLGGTNAITLGLTMWSEWATKISHNLSKNNWLMGIYLIKLSQFWLKEGTPLPPGEKWFSEEKIKTDVQRRKPENKNISWVFPFPEKPSGICQLLSSRYSVIHHFLQFC